MNSDNQGSESPEKEQENLIEIHTEDVHHREEDQNAGAQGAAHEEVEEGALLNNPPMDDGQQLIEGADENQEEQQGEDPNQNEEGQQENDSAQSTISGLISSVSNTHLMSEENIEAIREVLCKKDNIFYKLSPRDPNLEEELQVIIKWKAKIAEKTIGQALNYYHQKLMNSELDHLDKLMKILKSTKREMYLRRITAEDFDLEEEEQQDSGNSEKKSLEMTLKQLLPQYDAKRKFIKFKLNERYEVFLKVFEEKKARKTSLIDRIPIDVLQNHIFIYFNSFDLFKLRGVCAEWRELIRGMWHVIFRREMMEQVIAADLCNDIEMNLKLMSVKSPFYQKFGIFMKAITEIIDWNVFLPQLESETVDMRIKMLIVTFFRMIGIHVGFNKLSDFDENFWNELKGIAVSHLKTFIDSLFHHEFQFKSNCDLDEIKANFLDYPDISSFNIRQMEDKNAVMFQLFLRQLLVFAQLKNYLSLAQSYIILAKDKLKEVSKEWPHKKDFLEGAYKILLFKFVEIKDGQIVITKEDHERRNGLLRNIQEELAECMSITTQIQDTQPLEKTRTEEDQGIIPKGNEEVETIIVKKPEGIEKIDQIEDKLPDSTATTVIKQEESIQNEVPVVEENEKPVHQAPENVQEVPENVQENKIEKQGEEAEVPKLDADDLAFKQSILGPSIDQAASDLNYELAKLMQTKLNTSDITYERFIKSKEPDYIFQKNGAETRLYLDDMIKMEFVIQKVIKQHLLQQLHAEVNESGVTEEIEENKPSEF